jgi:hypothetical protein
MPIIHKLKPLQLLYAPRNANVPAAILKVTRVGRKWADVVFKNGSGHVYKINMTAPTMLLRNDVNTMATRDVYLSKASYDSYKALRFEWQQFARDIGSICGFTPDGVEITDILQARIILSLRKNEPVKGVTGRVAK